MSRSHHEPPVGLPASHLQRVILPLCLFGTPPDDLDSLFSSSPMVHSIVPPYPSSTAGTSEPGAGAAAPIPAPRVALTASRITEPPWCTSDDIWPQRQTPPAPSRPSTTPSSCCRGHQARGSSTALRHRRSPNSVSEPPSASRYGGVRGPAIQQHVGLGSSASWGQCRHRQVDLQTQAQCGRLS
jgi:hypothetical protein